MNPGEYYNRPVADWARRNLRGRVAVRPLLSRRVKDNQLELVFEGAKVIIPPPIRDREAGWALVNRLPADSRRAKATTKPDAPCASGRRRARPW